MGEIMLNNLKYWGCEVDEALERFVNDESLYIMCMNLFIEDAFFEILGDALKSQDYDAAREATHTLKGIAGNVSVGPLFVAISMLTDKLRANDYSDLDADYSQILEYRKSLKNILKS